MDRKNRRISGFPVFSLLALVLMGAFGADTRGQEALFIGPLRVLSGHSASGFLDVPAGEDPGSAIPVTVIRGAREGKTLALVAGVHGYEYPPILALYRLKEMIDPQELAGTLILVHIANLPSFQKRTIYYNPYDWKNLNRVFPGDPKGTLSQRTAFILTEEVVKKSDGLIDLHCGDGNEALIPYTYWMKTGRSEMDDLTRAMALAFGIPHIIIDETRSKDLTDSKYLGNTAVLLGKPAITTESGLLGRTDEESVRRNIEGILSVMRLFRMIEGTPAPAPEPVWIDRYEVVYSRTDGLFYPLARMGHYVVKGQKVGWTTDFLGHIEEELRAPFSGIMLYIINTPPTSQGEPLFEVGRVLEGNPK
ncbi:MAG: succinylglutamate desuccinylase/aspartoacylase family protein [Candidatus Aminicenantes bacterium]|nr:succinylglutamate desuccinylase/aspartoacylase family protein [Candidatus Aminicenantes bacterium]